MSFRLLAGCEPSVAACDLGFLVISKGSDRLQLRIALSARLLKEMAWDETTQLHLLVDEENSLGQLKAVLQNGRKIRVRAASGRGECLFRFTTDEEQFFEQYNGVCELTITAEDAKADSVTFELPPVSQQPKKKGGRKA